MWLIEKQLNCNYILNTRAHTKKNHRAEWALFIASAIVCSPHYALRLFYGETVFIRIFFSLAGDTEWALRKKSLFGAALELEFSTHQCKLAEFSIRGKTRVY